MGRVIGILIGGGLGAAGGYMIYPDLAFITAIIGAVIGVNIGNRGRKVVQDDQGEWYDGREGGDFGNDGDGDAGGGDD